MLIHNKNLNLTIKMNGEIISATNPEIEEGGEVENNIIEDDTVKCNEDGIKNEEPLPQDSSENQW